MKIIHSIFLNFFCVKVQDINTTVQQKPSIKKNPKEASTSLLEQNHILSLYISFFFFSFKKIKIQ